MISQFNDWINLSGGPLINPAFVGSVNYSVSLDIGQSFIWSTGQSGGRSVHWYCQSSELGSPSTASLFIHLSTYKLVGQLY